jgi:hypothetical protein
VEKARAAGCGESLLRQLISDGFIVDEQHAMRPPADGASAILASTNGARPGSAASNGIDSILSDPSQRLTEGKALVLNCIRNNAGIWKARALNRAIDEADSPEELFLTLQAVEEDLRPIAGEELWRELQTKVRALIK